MKFFTVLNILFTFRIFKQLALALKTEFPLKFFTVLNIFFTIQDLWATLCLPWKTELPWNLSLYWIYLLHSGVLTNLHALALKNRGCVEFTVLIIYFLSFGILEQLALSLQNGVALEFFTALKYFYHSGFLSNLRLPWKTELPWNLSLYGIYFLHSELLNNLSLPWKTEGALKFFTIMNIFFIILEFWVTCACPENRVAREFLTILNILYTFRIFEQLACACPEKQTVPWIYCIECIFFIIQDLSNLRLPWKTELPWNFSLCWNIFYHSGFLSNLRLPWKTEFGLKFFTMLKYILLFRIFEQLAVALKTEFALKFFKPGRPPDPPPGTLMDVQSLACLRGYHIRHQQFALYGSVC